jgi:hypothetical protein
VLEAYDKAVGIDPATDSLQRSLILSAASATA